MTGPRATADWNPEAYHRFRGLRLRPALDLLSHIPALPNDGMIVDLGCGSGTVGAALLSRFAGTPLHGVDRSPAMLEEAEATGYYRSLEASDITDWQPAAGPVSLIFSNAALNWISDHAGLLPRLVDWLQPGGTLAVQVPNQQSAPSHALLRQISADMFPDRFDWAAWRDDVLSLAEYASILDGLGQADLWETTYGQVLPPSQAGHPVRQFTQSTAARRVLDRLSDAEANAFLDRYDQALSSAYPYQNNGTVLFPFRRLFFILQKPMD